MIGKEITRRKLSVLKGLLLIIATSLTAGCSDTGPRRYPVVGSVTLDGQPVDDATIIFTPQAGGLAAAASIVNGHFAMTAKDGPTAGSFSVRINPNEAEMAEVSPNALADAVKRPRIPLVYQRDGKLLANIQAESSEPLSFELFSKER